MAVESQTTYNTSINVALYDGRTRVGQKLTIPRSSVSKLSFPLKIRDGNPTFAIYLSIYKVSDGSLLGKKLWGVASSLTSSWSWKEVTFDKAIPVNEEVYICVDAPDATPAGNVVAVGWEDSDVKGGELLSFYESGVWIDQTGHDCPYEYTYLTSHLWIEGTALHYLDEYINEKALEAADSIICYEDEVVSHAGNMIHN